MTFSLLRLTYIALLALVFSGTFCAAQAQGTTVSTPGAYVHTGDSGVTVNAPGVSINLPAGIPHASVMTPPTAPAPPTMPAAMMPKDASAASYVNAQLSGMDFSNQNLTGADFTNATLNGVNFSGANLTDAIFANADLSGSNLTNANLVHASLVNATLSNTNLTGADFSHADLTNATVDHALSVNTRFDGATLANVNMSSLVHQVVARPVFVDARAISSALTIDPAHPKAPRKIDLTVNFDFGSDKLTTDGAKQVAEIATALGNASFQKAHIVVEGHTDNVGGDAYNQGLSMRRAMRVMQTLTDTYHLPVAMLSAQGFGKTRPIASNDNDLGRAINRRVTLVNAGN